MFLLSDAIGRRRHDNAAAVQQRDVKSRILQTTLPNQLIGLEFEAEYGPVTNLALRQVDSSSWQTVNDDSLRNGLEYKSRGPRKACDIELDIIELVAMLSKWKARSSIRTSIHQHMDFTDYNSDELRCFLTVYCLCENFLYEYAGGDREKLLFCQRVSDTTVPYWLKEFLETGESNKLPQAHSRYCGLNLACLPVYGTIEFRHLPLSLDVDYILMWMELLIQLKVFCYTSTGNTAESVLSDFAAGTLFQKVFAHHAERVIAPRPIDIAVAHAIAVGKLQYPAASIDDNWNVLPPLGWKA